MIRRNLDIILIAAGFIFGATYVGYLVLTVPPERAKLVLLTPAFVALIVVWIGMVLMEVKKGEKTVKEAVATVAIQMLLLGLFILIGILMRK